MPFQDDWRASCGETRRLLLGKLRDTLVQQGHPDPQVWTQTHFFLFTFCKKKFDLPGKQIYVPSLRKHYSLPFLLATLLSLSRTHEGLFGLTWCPSRALKSPRALFHGHRQVYRARPGSRLQQLMQTLTVRLLKTHFCTLILDCEVNRMELSY